MFIMCMWVCTSEHTNKYALALYNLVLMQVHVHIFEVTCKISKQTKSKVQCYLIILEVVYEFIMRYKKINIFSSTFRSCHLPETTVDVSKMFLINSSFQWKTIKNKLFIIKQQCPHPYKYKAKYPCITVNSAKAKLWIVDKKPMHFSWARWMTEKGQTVVMHCLYWKVSGTWARIRQDDEDGVTTITKDIGNFDLIHLYLFLRRSRKQIKLIS